MPKLPTHPLFFYAVASAMFGTSLATAGGGWYYWQRGQQEAAKLLQHEDLAGIKEGLEEGIELGDLRKRAKEAGLNPDEVADGYNRLRNAQITPDEVLARVRRATITE